MQSPPSAHEKAADSPQAAQSERITKYTPPLKGPLPGPPDLAEGEREMAEESGEEPKPGGDLH